MSGFASLPFWKLSQLWPMLGFAFRTMAASMLALYAAFWFQLESPHWAWLTVWIVAQPTAGMMLSKSLYRLIGSFCGAVLGLVLIALFAQTPELFVFSLALLVAGCTVASNLLTNFRAYATVLTGYTAGIVAAGAISNPSEIFNIALARFSCIALGIGCSILVTSIFAPHRSNAIAREALKAALKHAAERACLPWQEEELIRSAMGTKLIQELISLNTLLEYAAAESGEFRLQIANARSLIAHLFAVISARRSLDMHLRRVGWQGHGPLDNFYRDIQLYFKELPHLLDQGEMSTLIERARRLRDEGRYIQPEHLDELSAELLTSQRLVLDRLDDLLLNFSAALEDWDYIRKDQWRKVSLLTLNFHRDQRAAYINGIRAFLGVVATGAFWIGESWPDGPNALIFVAIMMSLFSSQPNPDKVGWAFFKAGILAIALAVICKFFILSLNSNFEFLIFGLGLFLIPMGLLIAYPGTSAFAVSFSLVFLNLVAPANPMQFDFQSTINTALAILIGVLFGTLAYQTIFPPNPAAARKYVTLRIRLGLQILASREPIPDNNSWETRMYDRVQRLHSLDNPSGTPTDEWLDAGLGALILGLEILRLRQWEKDSTLSRDLQAAIQNILAAFDKFLASPAKAVHELEKQCNRIVSLEPVEPGTERRVWAQILGTVMEMRDFLEMHPQLIYRDDLGIRV